MEASDNITTQRLDGYRQLTEIARDLASTLDLDILLNRIVRAAVRITRAEAASILLYDELDGQLSFQVATNLDQPMMRGLVVPVESSIAGWIVKNQKAVRLANVEQDPRHFNIDSETKFKTRSLLGVPLITKDRVIGVLESLNKKKGGFTETDEDLLTVLGAQAAVAIENSRLFKQSDLIAEFVHELRTPLASINTATYLLLRPEIPSDQQAQIICSIQTETQRLSSLTSSFLDLARLESGRVQYQITGFDLIELIEECREMMIGKAQENEIDIKLQHRKNLPQIRADRDKIKQVLMNLISNAIKYNRPQGCIELTVTNKEQEFIISVADSGIGIPEEALPHIFEKFYRVRGSESIAPGTGLGLSICKQIIHGHGGQINVKSRQGEGTTFVIRLPHQAWRKL